MISVIANRNQLWDHTATIAATIANTNLGKNQRPYDARCFHPAYPSFHRRGGGGIKLTADNIDLLKEFAD